MPMNRLLFDHQLARLAASSGETRQQRETAKGTVLPLGRKIAGWRRARGLPLVGWPDGDAPTELETTSD